MIPTAPPRATRAISVGALAGTLLALALAVTSAPALAADASPAPPADADVRMTAHPLLGGTVRPAAWMAIRVLVENDGPAVTGELQVTGGQQADSRYGVAVELPTGARQEHMLYAQPAWFGSSLSVRLVSGAEVLLSQGLTTRAVDTWTPIIVVVAERPEGIVADLRAGTTLPNINPPVILTVGPGDLPPRVEAWSAIDRLVWQDVDSSALSEDQLLALRGWVGAGGRLVIVGGSTGTSTLGAFPPDLLPFSPARTVDITVDDLEGLLGALPPGATGLPAVTGLLEAGTVLGRTGDDVYAAQRSVGQGAVSLVGIDPSADWLTGTSTATDFWRRFVPSNPNGAVVNPLVLQDDSQIVTALSNLPAVDLPDLAVLFALLLLYVALIGPLNYLLLRRIDRREWAWVTMPILVGVFAVAAWGLGATLKGTDTIVNQVGIVRTATGTDRGIGQVYVGIFSPTRASYQVEVGEAPLLTSPMSVQGSGQTVAPLDVVQGDVSRLRDFQVGFSVLRSFRAEAAVEVPRLDADLRYQDGVLAGTLTNRSDQALESLAVSWGGSIKVVDLLEPGASVTVSLPVARAVGDGSSWSQVIFGPYPTNGVASRTEMTRRMVLDQLWWASGMGNGVPQQGPLIAAWTSGPKLEVSLGTTAKHVGDTLHLYPATLTVTGPTVWTNPLLGRSVIASDAIESIDQGLQLSLSRGTMTVEWRPAGFGGPFRASSLSMMLTQGEQPALTGNGPVVAPLPDAQQPPQDDPVGDTILTWAPDGAGIKVVGDGAEEVGDGAEEPASDGIGVWDGLPDVQLFDRVDEAWVELPHPVVRGEFSIVDPERYVDDTGAFLVRYVNRGDQGMTAYFTPLVRLEGDAA